MSGFENFAAEAASIELELQRKGVALGIDWEDEVQTRDLARAALACKPGKAGCNFDDPIEAARFALFGLAHLMLHVMQESAGEHIHTHGGPVWKAFARALWAEHDIRESGRDTE